MPDVVFSRHPFMDVDEMVRQHVLRTHGLPEAAKGDSFFVEDDEWSASFQEEMVALAASVSQVSRDVTKTKESPPLLPQLLLPLLLP